jgi:hypothetical protein
MLLKRAGQFRPAVATAAVAPAGAISPAAAVAATAPLAPAAGGQAS